jgi:hypothetical protein
VESIPELAVQPALVGALSMLSELAERCRPTKRERLELADVDRAAAIRPWIHEGFPLSLEGIAAGQSG